MTLYELVFFFPSYFLQLYAVQSGLNSNFAFYTVSNSSCTSVLATLSAYPSLIL